MNAPSDEDIMAFADGTLTGDAEAHMRIIVAQNEDVARQVALYQESRRQLAGAFDSVLAEPVPARFQKILDALPPAQPAGADPVVVAFDRPSIRQRKAPVSTAPLYWQQMAAGIAIALVAGFAGYGLRPQDGANGHSFAGTIAANDPMAIAFEAGASGIAQPLGRDRMIVPIASFVADGKRPCREFETGRGDETGLGLACKTDKGWRIEAWVATGQSSVSAGTGFVPAGPGENPVLAAGLAALGPAQFLDGPQEKCAIARHWTAELARCLTPANASGLPETGSPKAIPSGQK